MARRTSDITVEEIVEKPHWANSRNLHDIAALIESGQLKLIELMHADDFLFFLHRKGSPKITSELFLEWAQSVYFLTELRTAFRVLFEPGPAHRELDRARAKLARQGKPPKKPYPRRVRRFSVHEDELPQAWQLALQDMKEGLYGVAAPAPTAGHRTTTTTKLCEFAKVIFDENLPPEVTVETLTAYERSLYNREKGLSPRTVLSTLLQLRSFARYIGTTDEIDAHFAERIRRWEYKSQRVTPQKEAKVERLPTYAEILEISFDLLGKADRTSDPRRAQRSRNFGVAIALMCPFPLRLADTDLHFGQEILWDGDQYTLNICTSKTGEILRAPILPVFAFFIDQLVLQGSHPDHLEELRAECLATQRPLFVGRTDDNVHKGFVSYAWREVLGTGCHIARSKIHDQFAYLGQEGVELAMRACTQRSEKTAEFYRSRAFDIMILRGVHDRIMSSISEKDWEYFE